MRILHLISSLAPGGAERYVSDLAKKMVGKGQVVSVVFLSDASSLGHSTAFERNLREELVEAGVCLYKIGHECRRKIWLGGIRLRRVAADFRPDIVHCHLYYGLIFRAISFLKKPTVYTQHSHRLGEAKRLYPLFSMIATRFIGISKVCAEALVSAGARNVVTIYNGVSLDRLSVKKFYDIRKSHVEILAVGSLREAKNFPLLISAFSELLIRRCDLKGSVSLKIAGEGPLRAKLQRQINDGSLTGDIKLLGTRLDVHALLADADVFVMSSNWEGLPISLLEAMVTGVPVVVTDVGACREVVENCGAGLVVPANDSLALSKALEFVIENPNKRMTWSWQARAKSMRFSIESAVDQHLQLYHSIRK